ncbi:MAG: tripartite tricarboxylate transporter TctB family protein [Armatimonadota bacterium]|nr:tripartite tricarboxylate transporter TctB family protein [Armatimonadota bacterium]MDR7389926.1 tripartite tricarboxylate transporter TctB family protein [Armatimonadota bacterium]MDR7395745.1 tripartite tricarboxylate transporter TctB family protein [Armatimonadota bacterium]MDR7399000.1 tripartite tricarboxylate transporter TctB family protein [Armatimonadota bacterium]MDR7405845.1 tripartite tricarboxylate transporter TctB family protein [Armatimonadota bacterium]
MASGGEIRINASVVGGALLLVLAAVAFWGARGGTPAVWLFPRLAAGVMAVSGVLLVEEGIRRPDRVVLWESWREARDVLAFALGATLYALALVSLGFWMATALMVAGAAQGLQGGRGTGRLPLWLVTGLLVGLGFDALFVGVFGVPLPGGALWGGAPWRPWLP